MAPKRHVSRWLKRRAYTPRQPTQSYKYASRFDRSPRNWRMYAGIKRSGMRTWVGQSSWPGKRAYRARTPSPVHPSNGISSGLHCFEETRRTNGTGGPAQDVSQAVTAEVERKDSPTNKWRPSKTKTTGDRCPSAQAQTSEGHGAVMMCPVS